MTQGLVYKSFIRCRTGVATVQPGHYARAFDMTNGVRLIAILRCPACCKLFSLDGSMINSTGDPKGTIGCAHCEWEAVVRLMEWE